mgnify:CR=1 FL=1|jgi:hypothetical protein|nr:MAG TPA: LysM [Caudoviricetes sp.]
MKGIKVTDQTAPKKRVVKRRAGRLLTTGATICLMCLGCGIGLYTGVQIATASTVKADTAQVHVVQQGETLWDIARPIADAQGQDIREVVYQLEVNNELDQNCNLKPGQRLIIRY